MDTYGDKVVIYFKHFPLPFHKNATPASKASLAAAEQGKFWEYHDLLFKNNRSLTPATFERLAKELNLNMSKFKKSMANSKLDSIIDADTAEGKKHGVTGTPTFFVNGIKLRGAQPFASFQKAIDSELKALEGK